MKLVLFIDYENVQNVNLSGLNPETTKVLLFVGKSQTKIPISLVEGTQTFGQNLEWVKISGDGKNNLDFHIALEFGRNLGSAPKECDIVILSKDRGYDSIIEYAKFKYGVSARRVTSLSELPLQVPVKQKAMPFNLGAVLKRPPKKPTVPVKPKTSAFTPEVAANLQKIDSRRLPRTRNSLRKHIESLMTGRADQAEIDLIVEELFSQEKVIETNNRLEFRLFPEEPTTEKRRRR